MLRSRSFDLVDKTFSNGNSKFPKLKGSVGADLHGLEQDRAIRTDPAETRRRRTIKLTRDKDQSWGFTLQTYGIRNKRTQVVEVMSYVDYVEMHGPAWVAGMRRGDIILSVNGESVEPCSHKDLVGKVKNCGYNMRLVVLFEDCCHKVELHERYLSLKKLLRQKMKELRGLEAEEKRISEGIPLSRMDIFRQSTYSSTSSDWDVYSEIISPSVFDNVPVNRFAFRDNCNQSFSEISTEDSSNSAESLPLDSSFQISKGESDSSFPLSKCEDESDSSFQVSKCEEELDSSFQASKCEGESHSSFFLPKSDEESDSSFPTQDCDEKLDYMNPIPKYTEESNISSTVQICDEQQNTYFPKAECEKKFNTNSPVIISGDEENTSIFLKNYDEQQDSRFAISKYGEEQDDSFLVPRYEQDSGFPIPILDEEEDNSFPIPKCENEQNINILMLNNKEELDNMDSLPDVLQSDDLLTCMGSIQGVLEKEDASNFEKQGSFECSISVLVTACRDCASDTNQHTTSYGCDCSSSALSHDAALCGAFKNFDVGIADNTDKNSSSAFYQDGFHVTQDVEEAFCAATTFQTTVPTFADPASQMAVSTLTESSSHNSIPSVLTPHATPIICAMTTSQVDSSTSNAAAPTALTQHKEETDMNNKKRLLNGVLVNDRDYFTRL